MLAKVLSFTLIGLEGSAIDIEVDVNKGLPSFDLVGLPDTAVKESKERVRSAIKNSGKDFPSMKLTVNLAPADIKKERSYLDLAIAVGILSATNQILKNKIKDTVFLGELSLDGNIREVNGLLPILISARKKGYTRFVVPSGNSKEASYIEGVEVYPFKTLEDLHLFLDNKKDISPLVVNEFKPENIPNKFDMDLSYVKGQASAKRALEVAVSGGHNILMVGPPGTGKTMLAKCIPTIMPEMSFEEALEVTKIHSIAGLLDKDEGIITTRPFRSPHHTATTISLTGGGRTNRPGEISLAHNGVLFLDEMPEYSRVTLETLRQPLEDRKITITRANGVVEYPASFMFIGSMNPCPCGNYGSSELRCTCSSSMIKKYRGKISQPLMDRIDIHIEVDNVKYSDLSSGKMAESSNEVRKRVNRARAIQRERFKDDLISTNAEMSEREMKKYCEIDENSEKLLYASFIKLHLSARARSRIIKVARTIADLDFSTKIDIKHIAEAINYRSLDVRD